MINSNEISVIIQGALDEKRTLECLKSVREFLPEAEIILSTWMGSNTQNMDGFYDLLVLNQDPGGIKHDFAINNKANSINNFNRQLVSVKNGLSKASRKYCLKLRSDLELKNSNFLHYWDKFNKRNEKYEIFKHRVLCSVVYSREYSCECGTGFPLPFHPSDFWFFGLSEDLRDYFCDCPMQTAEEGGDWKFKYLNRLPYTSMIWRFTPEQFFCVNWVKKYYPNLQFDDWSDWNPENIELSRNILYNNFVFLSFEESGVFSLKHFQAERVKNNIQGLITYNHFQKCYQELCDSTYVPDKIKIDYEEKFNRHYQKLIKPFKEIKSWTSEIFSVAFYFLVLFALKYKNRKK